MYAPSFALIDLQTIRYASIWPAIYNIRNSYRAKKNRLRSIISPIECNDKKEKKHSSTSVLVTYMTCALSMNWSTSRMRSLQKRRHITTVTKAADISNEWLCLCAGCQVPFVLIVFTLGSWSFFLLLTHYNTIWWRWKKAQFYCPRPFMEAPANMQQWIVSMR